MIRRMRLSVAAGACLALLWCVPILAHHSLSDYDDNHVQTLDGRLVEVLFKNPHSYVTVEVNQANGSASRWTVEWLGALALKRHGVDNTTLRPGDHVIVSGNPSHDRNAHRLWLRTIKRPADGWSWAGEF